LQNPAAAFSEKNFFVSHRDHKDGLYETIFNEDTRFDDLLAADIMNNFVSKIVVLYDDDTRKAFSLTILALSKPILKKYYTATRPNDKGKVFNVNFHLMMITNKAKVAERLEILKIIKYTVDKLIRRLGYESLELLKMLLSKPSFYEILKDSIEKEPLDISKIQSIDLQNGELL
jgi:hypothetical protein